MLYFSGILSLILSFCSFSYEFLIIKQMQEIIGDGFIWRSLLVGVFVSFLGLGAFFQEIKHIKENKLFHIEIILSSLGLLVPLVFYFADNISSLILTIEKESLHSFFHYNILVIKDKLLFYKIFFYVVSFGWTAIIGFFSGLEMPILMNIPNIRTNLILTLNYWGSLLAAVFSAYFFTTFLKLEYSFLIVAVINIFVAAIIQIKYKIKSLLILVPCSLFFLHLFCYKNIKEINQFYKYERINNEVSIKDVFIKKTTKILKIESTQTKYQLIDKIFFDNNFAIFLDGHFQFDSVDEADYHETMVHIPLSIIQKNDPKVLVLGGGDGLIIRELIKHENINKIKQIELDKEFWEYSKNDLDINKLNNNSLNNKKLITFFEDAFLFLRKNKSKYDLIIIDFPYPYSYDLAKLYSKEFYSLVYENLNETGFFVMDLPLFSNSFFKKKNTDNIANNAKRMNDILYSTIKKAKFLYSHFYMLGDLEGYVIASKNQKTIDWNLIKKDERIRSVNHENLGFITNEVPHQYSEELVNSIFKPTILNFTDEINKY